MTPDDTTEVIDCTGVSPLQRRPGRVLRMGSAPRRAGARPLPLRLAEGGSGRVGRVNAVQRIHDYLRERRIARLRREVTAHVNARNCAEALASMRLMADEINARSPQQVARMERKKGLR